MPAQPSALTATAQWIPWRIAGGAISNKGAGKFAFTSAEVGQHRVQATLGGAVIAEAVTGDGVRTATLYGLPLNTTPTIQVRSENAGLSAWRTLALTVPAMPTLAGSISVPSGLAVDVSDPARVVVSWTDNANNEAQYHLTIRGPEGFLRNFYVDAPATSLTIPVLPLANVAYVNLPFATTFVIQISALGGKYKTRNFAPLETVLSAEVQFATVAAQIALRNLPAKSDAWNGLPFAFQMETSETPVSFAVSSGALPSGVTLDLGTGLVDGTPADDAGTYVANLRANNGGGHDIAALTIVLGDPGFTVKKGGVVFTEVAALLGVPFTQALSAVAIGPIDAADAWTLDESPDWLVIDAGTGELSGTPAASGSFVCQLTAGNGTQSTIWPFTLVVAGVSITSAESLNAFVGAAFSFQVTASPDGCTFTSGDLPDGVTLTGSTLAGTVAVAGDYEIDLGAHLGEEGTTQAFTLHVLDLFTTGAPWNMQQGQPQSLPIKFNGPGKPQQWFLSGGPGGLSIEFADFDVAPACPTIFAVVSGSPATTGIYDAEVAVRVMRQDGKRVEMYRQSVRIVVSGGLFLGWLHEAPERREVQLLLRSDEVRGNYFDATGGLMLVRGDEAKLHVILRDGPIHGTGEDAELGMRTIETGLTELRFIVRPVNDFDGDPYLNVGGTVAEDVDDDTKDVPLVAIGDDHVVPLLTFTPADGADSPLERDFAAIDKAEGEDITERQITGMGEWTGVLDGQAFTTLPFYVTFRQDVHRNDEPTV